MRRIGSIATLELLSAAGGDVNARISDITSRPRAWGVAARCRSGRARARYSARWQWAWPRVVQYLIDHGAEWPSKDDRRVSPLDAALGRAGSSDNRPPPLVAKILQTAIGQ